MACNHKYANLEFRDSDGDVSVWMYGIPRYLRGKIEIGDCLVVEHDGTCKVGEVISTTPVCPYRQCNVGMAIDRVDVKRWRAYLEDREAARLLMQDMAERQAELEQLNAYSESAKRDPEMREALDAYRGLSGDPATDEAAKAAEIGI